METTGLYSIWFQQLTLVLGLVFFFAPYLPLDSFLSSSAVSLTQQGSVWIFLACLVLSRVGLWTFDLAERQIMQEFVPEEKRGIINSVEFSLTNVFSLLSFGLGIVWSQPEQFGVIVIISFCAVSLAAVLYTIWDKCVHPFVKDDRVDFSSNLPESAEDETFL